MGGRLSYEELPLVQAIKVLMLGALVQGWPEEDLAWAAHLGLRQAVRQLDHSRRLAKERPQRPLRRVLGSDDEDEDEEKD